MKFNKNYISEKISSVLSGMFSDEQWGKVISVRTVVNEEYYFGKIFTYDDFGEKRVALANELFQSFHQDDKTGIYLEFHQGCIDYIIYAYDFPARVWGESLMIKAGENKDLAVWEVQTRFYKFLNETDKFLDSGLSGLTQEVLGRGTEIYTNTVQALNYLPILLKCEK